MDAWHVKVVSIDSEVRQISDALRNYINNGDTGTRKVKAPGTKAGRDLLQHLLGRLDQVSTQLGDVRDHSSNLSPPLAHGPDTPLSYSSPVANQHALHALPPDGLPEQHQRPQPDVNADTDAQAGPAASLPITPERSSPSSSSASTASESARLAQGTPQTVDQNLQHGHNHHAHPPLLNTQTAPPATSPEQIAASTAPEASPPVKAPPQNTQTAIQKAASPTSTVSRRVTESKDTSPLFDCTYLDIHLLNEDFFESCSRHPVVRDRGYFKLQVNQLPPVHVQKVSRPSRDHATSFMYKADRQGLIKVDSGKRPRFSSPRLPLPSSAKLNWSIEEQRDLWNSTAQDPPKGTMPYIIGNPLFEDVELSPGEKLKQRGRTILEGINTQYVYFNLKGKTITTMHREDAHVRSENLLRSGENKFWCFVKPAHAKLLEQKMKVAYREMRGCSQAVRHLSRHIPPARLDEWGVEYTLDYCIPGQAIVTEPGTYHQVLNLGPNYALAVNLEYLSSPDDPPNYTFCDDDCPDKFSISAEDFRIYRKPGERIEDELLDAADPASSHLTQTEEQSVANQRVGKSMHKVGKSMHKVGKSMHKVGKSMHKTAQNPIEEPDLEPSDRAASEDQVLKPLRVSIEHTEKSVLEKVSEPVSEPVLEPVLEPVAKPITEPVAEPAILPLGHAAVSVPEPIVEAVLEPIPVPELLMFSSEHAALSPAGEPQLSHFELAAPIQILPSPSCHGNTEQPESPRFSPSATDISATDNQGLVSQPARFAPVSSSPCLDSSNEELVVPQTRAAISPSEESVPPPMPSPTATSEAVLQYHSPEKLQRTSEHSKLPGLPPTPPATSPHERNLLERVVPAGTVAQLPSSLQPRLSPHSLSSLQPPIPPRPQSRDVHLVGPEVRPNPVGSHSSSQHLLCRFEPRPINDYPPQSPLPPLSAQPSHPWSAHHQPSSALQQFNSTYSSMVTAPPQAEVNPFSLPRRPSNHMELDAGFRGATPNMNARKPATPQPKRRAEKQPATKPAKKQKVVKALALALTAALAPASAQAPALTQASSPTPILAPASAPAPAPAPAPSPARKPRNVSATVRSPQRRLLPRPFEPNGHFPGTYRSNSSPHENPESCLASGHPGQVYSGPQPPPVEVLSTQRPPIYITYELAAPRIEKLGLIGGFASPHRPPIITQYEPSAPQVENPGPLMAPLHSPLTPEVGSPALHRPLTAPDVEPLTPEAESPSAQRLLSMPPVQPTPSQDELSSNQPRLNGVVSSMVSTPSRAAFLSVQEPAYVAGLEGLASRALDRSWIDSITVTPEQISSRSAFDVFADLVRQWRANPMLRPTPYGPGGGFEFVKHAEALPCESDKRFRTADDRLDLTSFLQRFSRMKLARWYENAVRLRGNFPASRDITDELLGILHWDVKWRTHLQDILREGSCWRAICRNTEALLPLLPPAPKYSSFGLLKDKVAHLHSRLGTEIVGKMFDMVNIFMESIWDDKELNDFIWEGACIEGLSLEQLIPLMGPFHLIESNIFNLDYFWPRPASWRSEWPMDPTLVAPEDNTDCDMCSERSCDCFAKHILPVPRIMEDGRRGPGVRAVGTHYMGSLLGELVGELAPIGTHREPWQWTIEFRRPDMGNEVVAEIYPLEKGNWVRKVNHNTNPSADFKMLKISGRWRQMLVAGRDIYDGEEITARFGRGHMRAQPYHVVEGLQ
ncbi:hypothetical protein B0H63DRAFT_483209 [Podospora didyma]|uniref:JmjC domain-containing protein n=1 Tax=Podospora didyma TaxID=330526 RepID=A0AAE0K898_9PEZI|nr:hypothetical protein B0H63DRAFT_483209 [Podospora didyma]